jgi:Spy/CpxP family protein refolding chaperone
MVWTPTTRSSEPTRRPFLRGLAAGGLLGGFLAAAGSAFAKGGNFSFWHMGRGCGRHSSHDPQAAKERAQFMSDWLLERVDASDEQRAQIKGLLARALDDLAPLREEHHSHRAAFLEALAQPAVDRAEVERVRKAEVALAERASSTVVASLAAIAEVLSPEQRKKLADLAARWHTRRQGV